MRLLLMFFARMMWQPTSLPSPQQVLDSHVQKVLVPAWFFDLPSSCPRSSSEIRVDPHRLRQTTTKPKLKTAKKIITQRHRSSTPHTRAVHLKARPLQSLSEVPTQTIPHCHAFASQLLQEGTGDCVFCDEKPIANEY